MSITVDRLLKEASRLPIESKTILIEELIKNLAEERSQQTEREQLGLAQRRLQEIRSGKVTPISGEQGLKEARLLLENI